MPLGTEVGLGQGYIVLDEDPPSPKRGTHSANFQPMFVVAKRLDGLRYHLVWTMEVGLGPGDIVLDWEPGPPWKGAQQPLTFQPISIVAK